MYTPKGGEGYPTHRFSLLLDIKVLNVTLGALAVDVEPLRIVDVEILEHAVEKADDIEPNGSQYPICYLVFS